MKLLNILSTMGLLLFLAIAVFQDLHTDKSANEDDTAPAARSPQRRASATSASAFFATTAVRESADTCVRGADPRYLHPLHHSRRMLSTGRRSQPRSPAWPTRARHQPEVLRRLLAYLGANREAPREYDCSHQSYGKGNVHITLEPGRKNLLRLRNWELNPIGKAARLTSPKS
jgi:hypothetical protein